MFRVSQPIRCTCRATNLALVGGNFYTLIRLPNDLAVMILGDVSGKGIEAALMFALVKTALYGICLGGRWTGPHGTLP